MPLTTAQKTQLLDDVTALSTAVNALQADTVDVAALQAQVASLTVARDAALQRIADAKLELDTADAADAQEDSARARARVKLG